MIFDFDEGFNSAGRDLLPDRAIFAITAHIANGSSALHFDYSQAIISAGATPIIIPSNCDVASLRQIMQGADALLLSGGGDIDARYFGEENKPDITDLDEQRDYIDFMALRLALDMGMPIFGICRGCQVINIALGGSIYQDLPSEYPSQPLPHSVTLSRSEPVHTIEIEEGSTLRKILKCQEIGVNSRHHQSIKRVAPQLRVSARSTDGVIEAIEGYPTHNIIALQCHPESMATEGGSEPMKALFDYVVSLAELYHEARKIHTLNPTMDSHCDTPMLYDEGGFDFAARNKVAKVDLVKMQEGRLDSTITVAYIPQSTPKELAFQMAMGLLERFQKDLEPLREQLICARTIPQVLGAKAVGKRAVMLGVENGLALGGELNNIDRFNEAGVVYITLCHNGSNDICDSAVGESLYGGVSKFGEQVIERMNSLGITIDISHSSQSSTMDALRLSTQPIIASHSSCRALCDHPRNLSDQTIKAIADKGGVVQVCGYGGFLRSDTEATIEDLITHIEHVIALTGYDHVGVGSDFDGGGGVAGFDGANNFINISVELLRRGHPTEGIAKIIGGNILRLLSQNLNS